MKLRIVVLLVLAASLNSCSWFGKNCKDEVLRNITQQELNFFPDYKVNDTLRYVDLKSNKNYFLACYLKETNLRKQYFHDRKECDGGGFITTYDEVLIDFSTTFPRDSNIKITYFARDKENLYISFVQTLVFNYDYVDNRIYAKPRTNDSTGFYSKVKINNTEYNNVHLLLPYNLYYDSIFYNSEYGFLRFVSTEGNKDIVLRH